MVSLDVRPYLIYFLQLFYSGRTDLKLVQHLLDVLSVAIKELPAIDLLADCSSNLVGSLSVELFSVGEKFTKFMLVPSIELDST